MFIWSENGIHACGNALIFRLRYRLREFEKAVAFFELCKGVSDSNICVRRFLCTCPP